MKIINPRLTVVGAGPGDADLITLKGVKAIQSADVLLYDSLVNTDLLAYAPTNALKIFVGKRTGFKAYSQDAINDLIVQYALEHGHVVRLKGGDPFVFGRGREEIDFAQFHSILTNYVPGISSAVGVLGAIGVPVTHRSESRAFTVLTATTSTGLISESVYQAANTDATVVILMGLYKLSAIVDIFSVHKNITTPVAVIQNGTLPSQKVVVGTLQNIVERVEAAQIASPAIIAIGEVVRYADEQYTQHNQTAFSYSSFLPTVDSCDLIEKTDG